MGGVWYGGPFRACPGEGCTNQINTAEKFCPECLRQQAAEELAISMWGEDLIESLIRLLEFEAWCEEHGKS